MGSNPCRGIQLLGIAHPVEGKLFQLLKAHQGMGRLEMKRWPHVALLCIFVKVWVKDPVFDNL